MKKVVKSTIIMAFALMIVCVGVFAAAAQSTFKTTSTVEWAASEGVFLDISADLDGANNFSTKTYNGLESQATQAWVVPTITLNSEKTFTTFNFTFANKGSSAVDLVFNSNENSNWVFLKTSALGTDASTSGKFLITHKLAIDETFVLTVKLTGNESIKGFSEALSMDFTFDVAA